MRMNSREKIIRKNNSIKYIKNHYINITFSITKLKYITIILFLILLTALSTNIIIFASSKYYSSKKQIIKKTNTKIICYDGFYIPNDNISICLKCSVENCNKCYGTIKNNNCISCISSFIPFYENNKIIECKYLYENEEEEEDNKDFENEEEEEEYIIKDFEEEEENIIKDFENEDKNEYEEIITEEYSYNSEQVNIVNSNEYSTYINYINEENICHKNYSFIAEYFTNTNNQTIQLINQSYINNIIEMIINGKKVFNNYNYTFLLSGKITVKFLLNITNIKSLYGMFSNIVYMRSINFTCQFDTKNIRDLSHIFYECKSLEYIDISNFNTENVENMAYMFYYCQDLLSINIINFNTQNVKSMNSIFKHCEKLESINVSNFDTKNVGDISHMFCHCFQLKSIDLSNFNTQKVFNIENLFYYCSMLKFINFTSFNNVSLFKNDYIFYNLPFSGLIIINKTLFNTVNRSLFKKNWTISPID